jgi:hypothetical protein
MSQAVLIDPAPIGTNDGRTEQLRVDADFERRWAAWQSRGREHERAVRRRLFMLVPAAAAAVAAVFLLLIR